MKYNFIEEFEIEDLGVQGTTVYDLGVEDNENFFANDILVHNSNYINLGPWCEKTGITDPDQLQNTIIKEIEDNIVVWYDEICNRLNHFENNMVMKREVIAERGLFIGKKKRYALSVIDDEGVRYETPKTKITGLAIKRSQTPKILKPLLEKIIPIILYKDNAQLVEYINECEEKFMKMDYRDISPIFSINNIDKYREGDKCRKGTPFNSRAAINYNNYIKDHNVNMSPIIPGERAHVCYLVKENPLPNDQTIIAFDDDLPKELIPYIDWDVLFEKNFIDIINTIIEPIGWKIRLQFNMDDIFN